MAIWCSTALFRLYCPKDAASLKQPAGPIKPAGPETSTVSHPLAVSNTVTVSHLKHSADTPMTAPDPASFRVLNPDGTAPVVLICDHASRAVPAGMDNLGLSEAELQRHIGWDPGTAAITERLSALLYAPPVLDGWSRLLIACNRAHGDTGLILPGTDGHPV